MSTAVEHDRSTLDIYDDVDEERNRLRFYSDDRKLMYLYYRDVLYKNWARGDLIDHVMKLDFEAGRLNSNNTVDILKEYEEYVRPNGSVGLRKLKKDEQR